MQMDGVTNAMNAHEASYFTFWPRADRSADLQSALQQLQL
jgi:hypothetical protein